MSNDNGHDNGHENGGDGGAYGHGHADQAHSSYPSEGWGGEYDSDATAFVQLPAGGLPESGAGADSWSGPLAAPGTGQGGYTPPPFDPAEASGGAPMTPAPTVDPSGMGHWSMPFDADAAGPSLASPEYPDPAGGWQHASYDPAYDQAHAAHTYSPQDPHAQHFQDVQDPQGMRNAPQDLNAHYAPYERHAPQDRHYAPEQHAPGAAESGAAAMGQGAAAALAGSHEARTQRRPLGSGGGVALTPEELAARAGYATAGTPAQGAGEAPGMDEQFADAHARRQVHFQGAGAAHGAQAPAGQEPGREAAGGPGGPGAGSSDPSSPLYGAQAAYGGHVPGEEHDPHSAEGGPAREAGSASASASDSAPGVGADPGTSPDPDSGPAPDAPDSEAPAFEGIPTVRSGLPWTPSTPAAADTSASPAGTDTGDYPSGTDIGAYPSGTDTGAYPVGDSSTSGQWDFEQAVPAPGTGWGEAFAPRPSGTPVTPPQTPEAPRQHAEPDPAAGRPPEQGGPEASGFAAGPAPVPEAPAPPPAPDTQGLAPDFAAGFADGAAGGAVGDLAGEPAPDPVQDPVQDLGPHHLGETTASGTPAEGLVPEGLAAVEGLAPEGLAPEGLGVDDAVSEDQVGDDQAPGAQLLEDHAPGETSEDEADLASVPALMPEFGGEHPHVSYVLRVNGVDRPVTEAWIGESLLYVLRERLGLAGAKDGCSQGECGACSVQVDGRLVASCLVPAATAAGSEIRTVEGLAADGTPSDVQRALTESGAVQCGFCVPGLAMTVHDLLEGNHAPSELEARQALSGNLCRCSGYRGVLDAVRSVVTERAARDTYEPDDTGAGQSHYQAAPQDQSGRGHQNDFQGHFRNEPQGQFQEQFQDRFRNEPQEQFQDQFRSDHQDRFQGHFAEDFQGQFQEQFGTEFQDQPQDHFQDQPQDHFQDQPQDHFQDPYQYQAYGQEAEAPAADTAHIPHQAGPGDGGVYPDGNHPAEGGGA